MIIGNNSNNFNNSFLNNNKMKNNQTNNNFNPNLLAKNLDHFKYTDPTNKNDMCDKSLAMLQDRYEKKLITIEQFQKQCERIRKNRGKNI